METNIACFFIGAILGALLLGFLNWLGETCIDAGKYRKLSKKVKK